jgi:hypothetical protein
LIQAVAFSPTGSMYAFDDGVLGRVPPFHHPPHALRRRRYLYLVRSCFERPAGRRRRSLPARDRLWRSRRARSGKYWPTPPSTATRSTSGTWHCTVNWPS